MKISIIIPVYTNPHAPPGSGARTPGAIARGLLEGDCGGGRRVHRWHHGDAGRAYAGRRGCGHRSARNYGKGAAIRAGIELASGDIVLIQDGDLEYDPRDYARILEPMVKGEADIV